MECTTQLQLVNIMAQEEAMYGEQHIFNKMTVEVKMLLTKQRSMH
ncbi:MAG TPA: hypothetical protein VLY84_08300 [Dysgonamonadaceae bacterium]|nr:hypothetical protein [Dysgonamonadaceae bacterium]